MEFKEVKDSGARQEFSTGSVRDTRQGKGRFDLISTIFLKRLARHYENGAIKYGDRNWEKGQPLSRYLDSAIRHLVDVLDMKMDEDHAIAAAWNIAAFVHTLEKIVRGELPLELDDIGWAERIGNRKEPKPIDEEWEKKWNENLPDPTDAEGWQKKWKEYAEHVRNNVLKSESNKPEDTNEPT